MATEMKLQPFAFLLRSALDQLVEVDTARIFSEPVDRKEVYFLELDNLIFRILKEFAQGPPWFGGYYLCPLVTSPLPL